MSNVLGNTECGCGCAAVPIVEGKSGTLSGKCPDCGAQVMIKSPAAVARWKGKFSAAPGAAKPAVKSGGLLL